MAKRRGVKQWRLYVNTGERSNKFSEGPEMMENKDKEIPVVIRQVYRLRVTEVRGSMHPEKGYSNSYSLS